MCNLYYADLWIMPTIEIMPTHNLYSITTNQAAIIALFRVINRYVGNLPPLRSQLCSAARFARSFRNLIHPGHAAWLAQTCDRATAYSAVGALEHVIRDLS
jgi:hypothetical protein